MHCWCGKVKSHVLPAACPQRDLDKDVQGSFANMSEKEETRVTHKTGQRIVLFPPRVLFGKKKGHVSETGSWVNGTDPRACVASNSFHVRSKASRT